MISNFFAFGNHGLYRFQLLECFFSFLYSLKDHITYHTKQNSMINISKETGIAIFSSFIYWQQETVQTIVTKGSEIIDHKQAT